MKQFLVVLVFTLGNVVCFAAVHITTHVSLSEKSAVHSLMLRYRECSGISFHACLCTRSISLGRANVSEVDHAGHAYSRVGRTTVTYTVRRSSTGMSDRLSCSSRNSPVPAFRVILSTCMFHVRLLVMVMASIFASVTR